jgi:hypothetical protein
MLREDDHIFQGFFLSLTAALLYIILIALALTASLVFKS